MEAIASIPRLRLNKKTISMLNNYKLTFGPTSIDTQCRPTEYCTLPECGSAEAQCRTDHYQSCAPCVPPKGEPPPYSKGGC